ncbi:FecR family protein [Pedobacter africanus]|uniref:FecR family protein n=1 Tax=Pedobacter africanus TaxID=151894 RepID=A0A1W1ZKQ5_9SPHI|nr:FecR family protein [Pedobacter africanus]SMC48641.1 FecR family protein [Pedobacter africanus]
MENSAQIKQAFYKYLNNELDEAEARVFMEHMQSGRDQQTFLSLIEENLDSPLASQLLQKPELLLLLKQSFTKITDTIDAKPQHRRIGLWPRVAAVLALIAIGIYFFNYRSNQGPEQLQQPAATVADITPGKTGATLTLANGKKIRLADAANGQIAREAGIIVRKTTDGQLVYEMSASDEAGSSAAKTNTLSTAKGETYIVTLPDKSRVWMNAASSLTYAAGLNGQERRVKLEGEAYFEIAKDKTRPFIVESRGQKIEVLGTHFNVNAYADEEKVTTTLLEGSVRVWGKAGSRILKPGNQSKLNDNTITVTQADTELATAWKNNKFLFENDDIRYIMRMIERWYDVEVVYTGEIPVERFGGGVSRFGNVSQVLKILESTGGAHFKIEGRKILVSK